MFHGWKDNSIGSWDSPFEAEVDLKYVAEGSKDGNGKRRRSPVLKKYGLLPGTSLGKGCAEL
ncbi:hypothetical protein ANCDUO_11644 [Ancylostoma duodenale]|uniref:Uncharacterized protein n=1 Tax=Ancylostoma duodenale TaxID=51022 RepID=A0A0C2D7P7_9BILA|nr:hypothetical protein ANCDUO_11644 [Ancylostoma duodenale]